MRRSLFLKILVFSAAVCASFNAYAQNVGINTTGTTPSGHALLDLNTGNTSFNTANGNRGVIMPQISLASTTDVADFPTGTYGAVPTGLIIYNTNASMTGGWVGFWYWNGAKWVALLNSSVAGGGWQLVGNAGTTAGTNFLGTTDAQDLVFKANGTEWARILQGGNLQVTANTAITLGTAQLSSGGNYMHLATNAWYNGSAWTYPVAGQAGAVMQMSGNTINFYTHNGAGTFTQTATILGSNGYVGIGWGSPQTELSMGKGEFGFCRADAADQTNYGRIGMDNGWTVYLADNAMWNTSTNQYNFVNGGGYGGWAAGIQLVSGELFFNNASGGTNPLSWNTRMFIAQSGNVGIGTTGPGYKLTVTGGSIGGNYGLTPNYASWATYGTGDGGAALYNDNSGFQTLMIVGNNSAGGVRKVGLWDFLEINGQIQINDGTQGSGKILTSDASGVASWSAPTSILVYGNNAHSVALTTKQSTTTTTGYVPVPGMTTTFTTLHNTVYIFASLTSRLDQGSGTAAEYGQAICEMAIYVDGTPVAYTGTTITDWDYGAGGGYGDGVVTTGTCSFAGFPVTVTPGSHTFALYWMPTILWATNPWVLMCNPASGAADECILTVFD